MFNRNKRVLWLLNHKTLMLYEVNLLIELNFEVFTPKIIPPDFRNMVVDFSYDTSLSIPKKVLARLNNFNFYNEIWSKDIVRIINRYFGTIYIIPYAKQVQEAVLKFEGQIMFRVFGNENQQTYSNILQILYGNKILYDISAINQRFWFAQGYEQLTECEPDLFKKRAVFLPVGLPNTYFSQTNIYTGIIKKILFLCPNCITNPYHNAIYQQFKKELGHFSHVIIGVQDVPVDDPTVLGKISDTELSKLYSECALFYYPSTELRHVHYSPIEAAICGMPVIYYAESLLGRLTPDVQAGKCTSLAEIRQTIKRILSNDINYINGIRLEQKRLSYKFSDTYCKTQWKKNLFASGYLQAVRTESILLVFKREIKKTLLSLFRHGLSSLPKKLSISQKTDKTCLTDKISFTQANYPTFIQHIKGLGEPELGGRWSLGSAIEVYFKQMLPKKFQLIIEGGGYGPNLGQPSYVAIDRTKQSFTFTKGLDQKERITLNFVLQKRTYHLKITVPMPTMPPNDSRTIGLGFLSLQIVPFKTGK